MIPYMPGDITKGTSEPFKIQSPLFFATQVNINSMGQNILGDAANEPSIAIDPNNPDRMVIAWRQFDNVYSNFRQAGYAFSLDGGESWTFPGVIEAGVFRSDPVLDCNNQGEFFYNSLSKDDDQNYFCHVFKTPETGFDWGEGVFAQGGDKQWMVIDKTAHPSEGNIYALWNRAFSWCGTESFTRSVDNGDSYEECYEVENNPTWGTLVTNSSGDLYVVGNGLNYNELQVKKSSSAADPESIVDWEESFNVYSGGEVLVYPSVNPGGLGGQLWIDIDKSGTDSDGYIYVLGNFETYNDPGEVNLMVSKNDGQTWSDPYTINDDGVEDNTQWFGTLSIAPNGRIDVVWLDNRDDGGTWSSLYYAYSVDNGETFSENFRLSESFNSIIGWPNQQKIGDYFHMISFDHEAHLAWAGTFNGEQDVYYGRISLDVGLNPEKAIQDFNLKLYPNPVENDLTIQYELYNNENIQIELYTIDGQMLKQDYLYGQGSGVHQYALSTSNLLDGVYVVKVIGDHTCKTVSFVKQ